MLHSFNLQTVKLYAAALITYVVIDMGWICYLMKDFYAQHLGSYVSVVDGHVAVLNWPAGVVAWALLALGQIVFVLPRNHGDYVCALTEGSLYGFIVYGVYQLTNYSIIREWSYNLVLYDIIWGVVINAVVAVAVLYVSKLVHYKHGEKCL